MFRLFLFCSCWLFFLLLAGPATGQAPVGDGLMGQYYDGINFERVLLIRRDATINFDWAQREPGPGLPAEFFSVRWAGWLVPPVSGRYKFHVTVDDGMRIWLGDKLILNEWRPQPVSSFTVAVELRAGQPYQLRVDYFQDILDTRARLLWERPDAPKPAPASWRNAWGLRDDPPAAEPIPTRYLFSKNPGPTPLVAASPRAAAPLVRPAAPAATGGPMPGRPALPRPRPRPAAPVPAAQAATTATDSVGAARMARLDEGEAVTMPDLYFNQGHTELLPAARTALNGLALALRARPGLRLEVQGHTDNVGDPELNRQLSQRRAEAVCLYLTTHGVPAGQLRAVGYGGSRPVADNADPAQRPKNRRVVLLKQ